MKNVGSKSRAARLPVGWQTLQPGGWEVAGGIFLLDFSFKALVRVVLVRGPSYFTIPSLQLDLRSWKLNESKEEDESKKDEICLMVLDNNKELSDTPYYSSSSLDSESLQNEYK
ncbi:hypothetical protein Tco_0385540 [Tanacetum coccineum]